MDNKDKILLEKYLDLKIPNVVKTANITSGFNGVYFVLITFHEFEPFIRGALNGVYKSGFSTKNFKKINKQADELLNGLENATEKIEAQEYFDMYFKCIDIVAREMRLLKNK